jgi:hypothetical protein
VLSNKTSLIVKPVVENFKYKTPPFDPYGRKIIITKIVTIITIIKKVIKIITHKYNNNNTSKERRPSTHSTNPSDIPKSRSRY